MRSCACIAVQVLLQNSQLFLLPTPVQFFEFPLSPFPHVCGRSRAGREVSALARAGVSLAPLHLPHALEKRIAGEKRFWSADLEQLWQLLQV